MTKEQGLARFCNLACAHKQLGLTLLEMLITLAIVSILLMAVAPNMSTWITKSRVTAEINLTNSILQHTRFFAIDRHDHTLLCPSSDLRTCDVNNWNLPKIMFSDDNFNQYRDPDETLYYASEAVKKGLVMTGPKRPIQFFEDGVIASPSTIVVCPERIMPKLNRALFVSLQGRIRLSEDTNGDDIHERGNQQPLTCS